MPPCNTKQQGPSLAVLVRYDAALHCVDAVDVSESPFIFVYVHEESIQENPNCCRQLLRCEPQARVYNIVGSLLHRTSTLNLHCQSKFSRDPRKYSLATIPRNEWSWWKNINARNARHHSHKITIERYQKKQQNNNKHHGGLGSRQWNGWPRMDRWCVAWYGRRDGHYLFHSLFDGTFQRYAAQMNLLWRLIMRTAYDIYWLFSHGTCAMRPFSLLAGTCDAIWL